MIHYKKFLCVICLITLFTSKTVKAQALLEEITESAQIIDFETAKMAFYGLSNEALQMASSPEGVSAVALASPFMPIIALGGLAVLGGYTIGCNYDRIESAFSDWLGTGTSSSQNVANYLNDITYEYVNSTDSSWESISIPANIINDMKEFLNMQIDLESLSNGVYAIDSIKPSQFVEYVSNEQLKNKLVTDNKEYNIAIHYTTYDDVGNIVEGMQFNDVADSFVFSLFRQTYDAYTYTYLDCVFGRDSSLTSDTYSYNSYSSSNRVNYEYNDLEQFSSYGLSYYLQSSAKSVRFNSNYYATLEDSENALNRDKQNHREWGYAERYLTVDLFGETSNSITLFDSIGVQVFLKPNTIFGINQSYTDGTYIFPYTSSQKGNFRVVSNDGGLLKNNNSLMRDDAYKVENENEFVTVPLNVPVAKACFDALKQDSDTGIDLIPITEEIVQANTDEDPLPTSVPETTQVPQTEVEITPSNLGGIILQALKDFANWLFVPSDNFLDGLYERYSNLDKQDLLLFPINFVGRIITAMDDDGDFIITIPAVPSWDGTNFFNAHTVNITKKMDELFPQFHTVLYAVEDFVFMTYVCRLAFDKFNMIFRRD